jgi:AraC-like DNA-binding protein
LNAVHHVVHRPAPDLRRYVREILWINSKQPRTQVLLPETAFSLVLRRSGHAALNSHTLPSAVISGLQPRTRLVDYGPDSSVIVVRLTEVGAPAMVRDHAGLFFGQTAPLDAVLTRQQVQDLQDALANSTEIDRQIPIVERFLADRIRPRPEVSIQIEQAARLIRNSGGRASIAAIARMVGMSQSALERRLRAALGTTPKMLARLARLQTVCRLWDSGMDLTRIATEAGYFDQPHMVRDFQLFTGCAPLEFLRGRFLRNLPIFYK